MSACAPTPAPFTSLFHLSPGGLRALRDVATERVRQIEGEGFTVKRDDILFAGQLASAAAVYAAPPSVRHLVTHWLWPFDGRWLKPTPGDRRRELVKAAALLIAEIERIDRADEEESLERGQEVCRG